MHRRNWVIFSGLHYLKVLHLSLHEMNAHSFITRVSEAKASLGSHNFQQNICSWYVFLIVYLIGLVGGIKRLSLLQMYYISTSFYRFHALLYNWCVVMELLKHKCIKINQDTQHGTEHILNLSIHKDNSWGVQVLQRLLDYHMNWMNKL